MNRFFLVLYFFLIVVAVKAQTQESISELTPISADSENFRDFAKRLSKSGGWIHSGKLKFNADTQLVTLPNGKKVVVVTIQTMNEELVFESIENKVKSKLRVYGRITSKNKKFDGFFEELKLIEFADDKDLMKLNKSPVLFRKVFELPEGEYQIGIFLHDTINSGKKVIKIELP